MKTLIRGSWLMKQGMSGFLLLGGLLSSMASAGPVQLQQGTATFSQTCCGISEPGSPAQAIDGVFSDIYGVTLNGWAVVRIVNGVEVSMAETAVWETASDVGPAAIKFRPPDIAD